ncbi:reverse transcriptase domain-containing protein [Trichonephila clavipes]|nr:reverse transcriptase domain-containing protein [Trichonephila clavipes]
MLQKILRIEVLVQVKSTVRLKVLPWAWCGSSVTGWWFRRRYLTEIQNYEVCRQSSSGNLKPHSHQGSQRLANQRLHLVLDEVSDWLDADCLGVNGSGVTSWKKFLDEINVNNVWKKIYTFGVKQQFQKRIELSGIALPSGAMTNSFEETINEVLFHSFPDDCENEVDDCHKEIRIEKAPGPDSIPNEVVKKLHEMYPDLFLTVFNSCLRLKTFPRCWKNAKIILIPKVNDVRVPKLDNLRCISLLSTLGKCFERLIINRVAWRLYKDNYFNKNQFGFMPHKCTEDALGKSFHDICRQAQLTLDFASTWTKNFKLEFNAVKSKVMFLEKREKNALTGNLTLNGFLLTV